MITQDISQLNPALNPQATKMSAKYVTMDSQKLVESILALTSKGEPVFQLRSIQFRKGRQESNARVGNHLIRIQTVKSYSVGKEDNVHPELVIKNSYDGSGQFEVRMGIFRLVCSNGLVIATHDFGEIKLRHMGTPEQAAFDLVKQFGANLPQFQAIQQSLIERQLTGEEKIEFAMKAAQVRFKNEFTEADAEKLLEATRPADEGNDMWKVFNRVQEKLMGSGFKGENMKKAGKAITRATEDIRINTELFKLAMSYINNDPESNPQPEHGEFEEIRDTEEEFNPEVLEQPDLETVTVPVKPAKFQYIGETKRRVPNPEYDRWMELYSDLV